MFLLSARFHDRVKFVIALPAASLIEPETDETFRSEDTSPEWTV